MPEPLFDKKDRVGDQPKLPKELEGKSVDEIVKYYTGEQQKAQEKVHQMEKAALLQPPPVPVVIPPSPPAKPVEPSAADFWTDPKAATQKTVEAELQKIQAPQPSQGEVTAAIEGARIAARDYHKDDWEKWEPDVVRLMNNMPQDTKKDPAVWEQAYFSVKGMKSEQIAAEAVEAAKIAGNKTPISSEAVGAAPIAPVVATKISNEEAQVAAGLELSDKQYAEGTKNMKEGKWPLTMSNTRSR